jgi:ATP-dependent DNA ligase
MTPSGRTDGARRSQPARPAQPGWLDPQLATLTQDRFSDPAWIFERKLDGERCLAFRDGLRLRLMTRNQLEVTTTYPARSSAASCRVRGCTGVEPRLVGQVVFTEWTPAGQLRHPRFQGLRRDEDPVDVVRETP